MMGDMSLNLPTLPHGRRYGFVLLVIAVLAVIVQVPGNTVIAVLLPPIALLLNGIRLRGHRGEWTVWLWMALMLVPSFIAMLRYEALQDRSYFIVSLALVFFALVVLRGSDGQDGARWLMRSLQAGLVVLALIGVAEVITNYKLLFIRYPNSVVASWVDANRFWTTSMYPNYNDFSVALVVLSLFLAARFLVKPGSVVVQVWRVVAVLAMAAWVLHMGSRGALVGLAAGLAILVILTQRRRDITSVPAWLLTSFFAVVITGALVLSQTAFVQDEDTDERALILGRLWHLATVDPSVLLFGFGSPEQLDRYARGILDAALVNPHNIIAETFLWGGVFGFVGFTTCWCYIAWQAVRNRTGASWYAMAAVTTSLAMPLLGVTPSVILHYMYPQLLMIAAIATFDPATREEASGVAFK